MDNMSTTDAIAFKKPESHRFLLLDGLRGLAAILVVFWHAEWLGFHRWVHTGYMAVDFFFCLSGFVIAFSYESRLRGSLRLAEFCKARVVRLYPVYILGSFLGLAVALALFRGAPHTQLAREYIPLLFRSLFMLPVLDRHKYPFLFPLDQPAWSLFYELVANIIFAAAIRAKLANDLLLAPVLLIVIALFSRSVLSHGDMNMGAGNASGECFQALMRTLLSFLLGALSAHAYRRWHATGPRTSPEKGVGLGASLVTLLLVMLLLFSPSPLLRLPLVQLADAVLFFPALVFLGATAQPPQWSKAACVALGELSYPLYLLHMPMLTLFTSRHFLNILAVHPDVARGLFSLAVVAMSLLSWAVAKYIDLPVRRQILKSTLFRRPQSHAV